MYIHNKNHKLTENQVQRFIKSCPPSIDPQEFMALVCLMLDLYDFDNLLISDMMGAISKELKKHKDEQFKPSQKISVH